MLFSFQPQIGLFVNYILYHRHELIIVVSAFGGMFGQSKKLGMNKRKRIRLS